MARCPQGVKRVMPLLEEGFDETSAVTDQQLDVLTWQWQREQEDEEGASKRSTSRAYMERPKSGFVLGLERPKGQGHRNIKVPNRFPSRFPHLDD